MVEERRRAVVGWATANRIDTPLFRARRRRLCIVTVGKAHQELMQALANLEIREAEAEALGLSIYKVAMSWPLASEALLAFAHGHDELLVIQEKAPMVENQIKAALFHATGNRPRVTGKTDADGRPLLPTIKDFDTVLVVPSINPRYADYPAG